MTTFKRLGEHHMNDNPVTLGKASVSVGGTATAVIAEHLHNFTLSDGAAIITILYTGFMLYCAVCDRLEKRRNKKREAKNGRKD